MRNGDGWHDSKGNGWHDGDVTEGERNVICDEKRGGGEEVLRAHNLASKSRTLFVSKEHGGRAAGV